jgi:hypothetical protein
VVGSRTLRLTDGRQLRRLRQEPVERQLPFREPEAASLPPSLWGRRLGAPTRAHRPKGALGAKDRYWRALVVVVALAVGLPTGAAAWNRLFPGHACADYQPWIHTVEANGRDVLGPAARVQTFEPCDASTRKLNTIIAVPPNDSCEDLAAQLAQRLADSATIKKLGRLDVACQGAGDHLMVSAPDTFRG